MSVVQDELHSGAGVGVGVGVGVGLPVGVVRENERLQAPPVFDVPPGWQVPWASGKGARVVPSEYTHCSPLGHVVPAIPPQATPAAPGLLSGAVGETEVCLNW